MSAQVKNPLPPLKGGDSLEAARLFNITCAICHGANAQATGPLLRLVRLVLIANLTLPQYVAMADGNDVSHHYNMGKIIWQICIPLTRKQRWERFSI
jgi:hypothetical protein